MAAIKAKREGRYLAKQGEGKAFPSEYGIYVEQTGSILDTENFLVGSSYCSPGKEHETHVHPDHDEVILFLNGVGTQTVGDDEVYEVREGDMVYLPAGVPHSIRCDCYQPLRMVIIKVNKGKVKR
ncbi:MAG: cupin domain-containing protein [Christensenellaceae bacterium]|jgi:quercetin dioxygenase-like cupin family protein